MEVRILDDIFDKLSQTDFFFNLNENDNELDYFSKKIEPNFVISSSKSNEWESIRMEGQSALTILLNKKFQNQFQEWNKVVFTSREFCNEHLKEKSLILSHELNALELAQEFIDDINLIIAEMYFMKRVGIKAMLFSRLFRLYECGHFPCGYSIKKEEDFTRPVGKILYI